MQKLYPILIVLVVIAVGGIGVYLLLNQKSTTQTDLNLSSNPTPTSAIINSQNSNKESTSSSNMNNFQTLPNGLKIQDEVVGNGQEVKSGDTVTVNYIGTLENGTKFDSSYDRNQPFTTQIGVGQVIKGWDEGIVGMKEGGKRKLIIPADLGYGSQGVGSIPPNSTLIFEIELLSVN